MAWSRLTRTDAVAGTSILVLGAIVIATAAQHAVGSLRNLGPGAFPLLLGIMLVACGAGILLVEGRRPADTDAPALPPQWRALGALILAVLTFAALIDSLGLLPAIFATVFLSALASPHARLLRSLGISVVMSALAWLIFIYLLQLQFRVLVW